ncbi:MAG: 50S ribosomal protein L9 [Sphaerochaetaceae bacterium]|nr:50S ribosomal protein L9 [Sphaerochaetaceae bacterium]
MKIILNQDVPNLGEEGDVCEVKNGYARNYLLPSGAAVHYNKCNVAIFASRAAAIEKRKVEKRAAAATLKEKLDALTLNIVVSAGESGKLFGSVTSSMVQDALAKAGIDVDRKKIEVSTHAIKMTGTYQVRVHLYESEVSLVKMVVESEADVKKRQAIAAAAAAAAAKEAEKAALEAAAAAAAAEAEKAEALASEAPAAEQAEAPADAQ